MKIIIWQPMTVRPKLSSITGWTNGTGGSDGKSQRRGKTVLTDRRDLLYEPDLGMFAGEESVVTMEFPKRLIGVVLDRFGREVDIRPMSDTIFRVRAKVAVSGQFFGWLAGIGPYARIAAPEAVQKRLCTVAFGYFAGTCRKLQIKNLSKISLLFLYSFLKDPSLTRQGFFFILIDSTQQYIAYLIQDKTPYMVFVKRYRK